MRLVIKQYLMTEHPNVNYLIIKKQERELGRGGRHAPVPLSPSGSSSLLFIMGKLDVFSCYNNSL